MVISASDISAKLRQSLNNKGFSRFVLGLSGGLDSAVAAKLGADAIGKENVVAYFLPHVSSNPGSRVDALNAAQTFGIRFEELDITSVVKEFTNILGSIDGVNFGNILSRVRMTTLFDRSAHHEALVLGTANKSELLLGYNTIFGDSACAINPLGDLYKTQVKKIALEIGVPENIINKAPSADHYAGQTDEGDLGYTYEAMDLVLSDLIENKMPVDELIKKYDRGLVLNITARVNKFAFKRRQPEIISIGQAKITD